MTSGENRPDWCKIIQSPTYGAVLVTRNYDEDDEPSSEKVNIEFRSRFCMTITWGFSDEDKAQAAFDGLTAENIDAVRAGDRSVVA